MLLAFNLLIIIYPYPITSGLLWKELYINYYSTWNNLCLIDSFGY
ncbi:hypothetical protein [Wolbachia endosymbiont (group A) of Sphecodes monilicornis]|nr:hypothetical protein [Wolbachia endosymbiont (group A) of Sphecodes monilicornis]